MAYYQYLVSVTSPTSMSRSSRSSSVDRYSSGYSSSSSLDSRRYLRASTVGPSNISDVAYYGVMPFSRQLRDIESSIRERRAATALPPPVSTYWRAFASPYGRDSKVTDYANRLDFEETTRNYINSASSSSYATSAYSSILQRPSEFVRSRGYDISSSPATTTYNRPWSSDYASIDGLYSYKHYRKSNATLKDRNSRAMSPIMGRELDRYYKTERRSDYMGDISSGGVRDFRYYNYRTVPYFGGSDHYALSTSQLSMPR